MARFIVLTEWQKAFDDEFGRTTGERIQYSEPAWNAEKTALVANHGDGTVSVIDFQKMEVTSNFHAGIGIETLSYY